MARELKVWGYTLATYGEEGKKLGYVGDRKHVRQCRAIVATRTKKEAIEKFGITAGEANGYMGQTGNERELKIALAKPGQVFAFPLDYSNRDQICIEIERTPHVPMKRAKRLSYEEQKALWDKAEEERQKRRFTRAELEYMVEMFEGGNNPDAASIAEKAKLLLGDLD